MRLLRIDIGEFRSIKDQRLPADGLVVLFGPNSSGKTSVLEAVEQLITEAATPRSDPGEPSELFVMGSVLFALPAAGEAGSADARTYMSLLRGEYNSDDPWDWLGKGVKSSLREAGVREAATLLAAHLVDAGSAGTREDRELLAHAVFDPGAVIFAASNGLTINLVAYGPWLPAETMGAARRIAAAAQHGGDPLRKFASDLTSKGAARIASVAGGAGFPASFEPAFPPVITLDGDPESLSTQLERAIRVIHDLLWHSEPELAFPPQPGGLRFTIVDDFYVREGQGGAGYVSDSWLEARSESGEPVLWEGAARAPQSGLPEPIRPK